MIGHDEIRTKAQEFDLTTANVQRDYIFGWLIAGIYQESPLGQILTLKGGNALRKAYFPNTRFSDDLDFTTEQGLDPVSLITQFNEICRLTQDRTGVQFDLDRNRIANELLIDKAQTVYKINLYFKDFSGEPDHITLKVKLDVAEFSRPYLPTQERNLIHPYSDATECSTVIRCVKLEEALADKMKCLLQRRYCYDIFDLVYGAFIAREIEVDRNEIVQVFLKKTIFQASPVAARDLLVKLPFDLFRGFWSKVVCPAVSRMSFERAAEVLVSGMEGLFGPFNYGQRMAPAFYPAELRNLILQAGSERKLLRVTYHGATRLVEPSSLAFKRTKAGVAQEYWYAWDVTGGNSGPGIKTFCNYDVVDMQMTDQTFEPRFPIELSKAGAPAETGYFSGNLGGRRSVGSTRRVVRGRSARTFVVQCGACGKQFSRKTMSTRLNDHKDKYGNRCFGRVGYRIR
jgi:predicted nucleotidyltransferase component of viral defense system